MFRFQPTHARARTLVAVTVLVSALVAMTGYSSAQSAADSAKFEALHGSLPASIKDANNQIVINPVTLNPVGEKS